MNFFYTALIVSLCACSVSSEDAHKANEASAQYKLGVPSESAQKVLIHYLPWFGGTSCSTDTHWQDGIVNEPLIGCYDSKAWSTHLYHILISAAVGVDGAMINVKTDYDKDASLIFMDSLERVRDVYPAFDYSVSISLDDQDMTESLAATKFQYIKNEIIASYDTYLHKDEQPVIFIWMYDQLTSSQYRSIADEVFSETNSILIKNDIDVNATANDVSMNAYYPWVKGSEGDDTDWSTDGSVWGEKYLDWFYQTSFDFTQDDKQQFVVGAVWPGFDDRLTHWGQSRWIDRREGGVYQDTWAKIVDYDTQWAQSGSTDEVSLDWVVIETWNDFNEGTEIEPIASSLESEKFRYLQLTSDNIASYKNTDSNIDAAQIMFSSAVKIYEAAKLIEEGDRDEDNFYPVLKSAIKSYLQADGTSALLFAEKIISE